MRLFHYRYGEHCVLHAPVRYAEVACQESIMRADRPLQQDLPRTSRAQCKDYFYLSSFPDVYKPLYVLCEYISLQPTLRAFTLR